MSISLAYILAMILSLL